MGQLLAVLAFESLCKTHMFNFKSSVSQSIRGFQSFGNFQKNQKNTKIQQNVKNVKSDLLNTRHRDEVISSEMKVRGAGYWQHYVMDILGKTLIINFKSALSQPICVFKYFRPFQKIRKKNKIQLYPSEYRVFNILGISKKIRKTQKFSKISKMSKVMSRASCTDMRSFRRK